MKSQPFSKLIDVIHTLHGDTLDTYTIKFMRHTFRSDRTILQKLKVKEAVDPKPFILSAIENIDSRGVQRQRSPVYN